MGAEKAENKGDGICKDFEKAPGNSTGWECCFSQGSPEHALLSSRAGHLGSTSGLRPRIHSTPTLRLHPLPSFGPHRERFYSAPSKEGSPAARVVLDVTNGSRTSHQSLVDGQRLGAMEADRPSGRRPIAALLLRTPGAAPGRGGSKGRLRGGARGGAGALWSSRNPAFCTLQKRTSAAEVSSSSGPSLLNLPRCQNVAF